jgi:ADP-ribose pyrophosphatase
MDKTYKILSEELTVSPKGKKHQLVDATVELPNGETRVWQYIKSRQVVSIAAITDKMEIWCVRQWRVARNEFVWELPAGGVENINPTTEQILEDANRELQEEIGLKSNSLKLLAKFSPTIHFQGTYYAVQATDLVDSKLPYSPDEQLDIKAIPFDEAFDLLVNQQLPSAVTLVSMLAVRQELAIKLL